MNLERKLLIFTSTIMLAVIGMSGLPSTASGQDYEAIQNRLLKSVKKDGLSLEQAAAMMKVLRESSDKGKRRIQEPKSDRKIRREPDDRRKMMYDKAVAIMKEAIENGRVSEEDGKRRLAELKKKMKGEQEGRRSESESRGDRRRNGQESDRPMRGGDWGTRDRAEVIRQRMEAAEKKIAEMIESGRIDKTTAKERMENMRKRAEGMLNNERQGQGQGRGRGGSPGATGGDGNRDGLERVEIMRRRIEAAQKDIAEKIKSGQIDKSEGKSRLEDLRQRRDEVRERGEEIRRRNEEARKRGEGMRGGDRRDPRGERDRPRGGRDRTRPQRDDDRRASGRTDRMRQMVESAEKEMAEMIDKGRITQEQATARLEVLRARIKEMQQDESRDNGQAERVRDGRGRGEAERGRRPSGRRGPDSDAREGRRPPRGGSDRGGRDSEGMRDQSRESQSRNRRRQAEDPKAQPFMIYRETQSKLLKQIDDGEISRQDARKELDELKQKLWPEQERRRGERPRRRRGAESDRTSNDQEIENVRLRIRQAVQDGVEAAEKVDEVIELELKIDG